MTAMRRIDNTQSFHKVLEKLLHLGIRHSSFGAGVFVSSWLGGLLLQVGEWLIKKLPLVKHIYSAAKQVSAAVNPSNESTASFRECVIVRHPRQGELAFGFITGQTTLAVSSASLKSHHRGAWKLCDFEGPARNVHRLII